MQLETNNHSVFFLQYHLILTTDGCRDCLTDVISCRLSAIFQSLMEPYRIDLIGWDYGSGYVHAFFRAEPNSMLSKFINIYKSVSSRRIQREFSELATENGRFWSRSFCLVGDGKLETDTIAAYCRSQVKNGQRKDNFK